MLGPENDLGLWFLGRGFESMMSEQESGLGWSSCSGAAMADGDLGCWRC